MNDEQPRDYADDLDKRTEEYYDRKTKHREELLRPLVWVCGIAFVGWAGWQVYNIFMMLMVMK